MLMNIMHHFTSGSRVSICENSFLEGTYNLSRQGAIPSSFSNRSLQRIDSGIVLFQPLALPHGCRGSECEERPSTRASHVVHTRRELLGSFLLQQRQRLVPAIRVWSSHRPIKSPFLPYLFDLI